MVAPGGCDGVGASREGAGTSREAARRPPGGAPADTAPGHGLPPHEAVEQGALEQGAPAGTAAGSAAPAGAVPAGSAPASEVPVHELPMPDVVPAAGGPLCPQPFTPAGRKVVVTGLLLLGLFLVYQLRGLVSLGLVSLLLAYLLAPAVDGLSRLAYHTTGRPLPRWAAILAVFTWLASLLALASFFLVPPLVEQLTDLVKRLPDYYQQVSGIVAELRRLSARELPPQWRRGIEGYLGQLGGVAVGFVQNSIASLFTWIASALGLVLIPIFTFFMLRGAPGVRLRILAWFPQRLRPEVDFLVSEVNTIMFRFLRGRLLVAFIVAVLVGVGNWMIGVPYPLVLGLAAGLLDLIPFIGPVLAAIPAIMLALLTSPTVALWVVVLYTLVQQLENLVLSPRLEGGELELNPGVVIFAATAAGTLFGFLGVLLAIPIAALTRVGLLYLRAKLRGEPLRAIGVEAETAGGAWPGA